MNARQAKERANGSMALRLATRQDASTNCNCVVVKVADRDTGFDAGIQGKLFTAFYSARANAIGVGPSISRVIDDAQHGEILASAHDGGMTFAVLLPSLALGDTWC